MKLTKGALTMLLAQYRAVYKNAFFKGLASAALATAVLASGVASAAAPEFDALPGEITTDTSVALSQDKTSALPSLTINVANANEGLKLTGSSKGTFSALDNLTITKGTLSVGASATLEFTKADATGAFSGANKADAKLDVAGTIDFGKLEAKLNTVTLSANAKAGKITGEKLTIDEAQLSAFLTGDNTNQGAVELKDNGTLNIVDTAEDSKGFDLTGMFGAGAAGKLSIASGSGATAGVLNADKLLLSGALTDSQGADKIDVTAGVLNLGSKDGQTAFTGQSGLKSITVTKNLNSTNVAATITEEIILETPKDTDVGTITSDAADGVITVTHTTDSASPNTPHPGKLNIKQGTWNSSVNIKVDGEANDKRGEIIVGDKTNQTANVTLKFGEGKSLETTANGKITVEGKADNKTYGILDLSNKGSLKANAGEISIGKNGSLLVNTNDVANLIKGTVKLGDASSKLSIRGGDDGKTLGDLTVSADATNGNVDKVFGAASAKFKGTVEGKSLNITDIDNSTSAYEFTGNTTNESKVNFENVNITVAKTHATNNTTLNKITLNVSKGLKVADANGNLQTLVVGKDNSNTAKINLDGFGSLEVSDLQIKDTSEVNVVNGAWTTDNTISVASGGKFNVTVTDETPAPNAASGKEGLFTLGANGKLSIASGGVVTVGGSAALTNNKNLSATLDLTNGTIESDGAINIEHNGVVNISDANLKEAIKGANAKIGLNQETAKLVIKDGNTLGNLTLDSAKAAGAAGKIFKDDFKGTVQGNDLTINEIEAAGLTITGNDAKKSIIDFANINFEAKPDVAENEIKATVKKAELKVSDGITVSNGGALGELVLGDNDKANKSVLTLNGNGIVNLGKLTLNTESLLNVQKGNWTFATEKSNLDLVGSYVYVGDNANLVSNAALNSNGESYVYTDEKANASFNRLNVSGDKLTVLGQGTGLLTINGTTEKDTAGKDVADITLAGTLSIENGGYVVIGKDALGDLISDDGTITKEQTALLNKIASNGAGTLKLNLDNTTTFTKDSLLALKNALGTSGAGTSFDGFVNIGDATVSGGLLEANAQGRYEWDSKDPAKTTVKDFAQMQFTNNALESGIIEVTSQDAATGELKGSFGSFYQNKGTANLNLKGNTSLSNAKDNGNMFIANEDATGKVSVGSANVDANMSLTLKNGGEIKDVKLGDANASSNLFVINSQDSTTTLHDITGVADTTNSIMQGSASFNSGNVVANNITLDDTSFENVKSAKINKLTTNSFDTENSNVTVAENVSVSVIAPNAATGDVSMSSILGGDFVASKDFIVKDATGNTSNNEGHLVVANNGHFEVKGKLEAGNKYSIDLGNKLEARDANDPLKKSSATMFVKNTDGFTGKLNLTSGDGKATVAVVGVESPKAGLINPDVVIKPEPAPKMLGRVGGVGASGGDTTPVANTPFSTYKLAHTANLDKDSIVAYGFTSFEDAVAELEKAKLLTKDHSLGNGASAVAMFNVSTNIDNATGSISLNHDVKDTANNGVVKLGADSVLAFTDKAFTSKDGKKDALALNSTTDGKVVLDKDAKGKDVNSKIVLAGNFSEQDKNLHILSGNLKLKDGSKLRVESVNGLLVGELDSTGILKELHVDEKALSKLRASYPVKQYILKFAKKDVEFTKKNADVKLDELAQRMAFGDEGVAIEQAARFAVYGGSVKAAELASKAGSDAIKSYTNASANVATAQTATGSIFVVPTYKSSESDSFNAEGVDFGSDIKLSGVALGADYMVAPNVKVGAMFNIGKGDADGKGIASGVETDLDYVGGGLFVNYTQDALSVTADLTYTQSSADMNANVVGVVDANKMSADVDTSAISLGVQGSYKFDLDGSYATPYAGVRLTKYDIDSYTVQVDGKSFLNNDADTMTVFSIPVGVELGTQVTAGDWTVEPSLDLGVTFNLGNTDLTHSATAVTKTSGVNLTSEVLDDVVFGIKGALKANYNGLTLGLGLGYEVGSNADDLSVQATGVYTF